MDLERWELINRLYYAALEVDSNQRMRFLEESCHGDADLRAEVEALLAIHERAGDFLGRPALEAVARQVAEDPPSLVGCQLGPYQVLSLLGSGGMGVVYKARDTRLNRIVAIKVLPRPLAERNDSRRRFEREARAIAGLNHPNICALYDIGSHEGIDFLVMEYLEGQRLSEWLKKGPLPLEQLLQVAIEVASALEEAHRHGVIHRDLKPGNIIVTGTGVKVLDFGLAKHTAGTLAPDHSGGESLTEAGMILGTVEYMSPEQVEGKEIDARTDLFSFGVLLYQMATGTLPFNGNTSVLVLNAILNQTPTAPAGVNPDCPAELEHIINKLLEKDREVRYQVTSELRADLKRLKRDTNSGRTAVTATQTRRHDSTKVTTVIAVAVVALVAAGWWWLIHPGAGNEEANLTPIPLTTYPGAQTSPNFSPDGSQVAFCWNGEKQDNYDIYIKQIGVEPPSRLTTAPEEDFCPAWSPDGRTIAFLRDFASGKTAIMLTPQRGGRERQLAETDGAGFLAWTPDSKWLVGSCLEAGHEGLGLYLFSIETGEKRRLTTPTAGIWQDGGDFTPSVSPDGRALAFARHVGTKSDLYSLRLGGDYSVEGQPDRLATDNPWNSFPIWMPNSSEVVFQSGAPPQIGLWRMKTSRSARPHRLAFAQENVDRPAISRQGNRLAYGVWKFDLNIWRIDLREPGHNPGTPVRLIASTREDREASYSSDGKRIAFVSDRSGSEEIWTCGSDGSVPTQLTSLRTLRVEAPRWSPDDQRIVFHTREGGQTDLYVVSSNGGAPRRLTTSSGHNEFACWSPNGQWLYFSTNRGGSFQIWRMPSNGGEAVQITRNPKGAADPHLSNDGKVLYYDNGFPNPKSVWKMPAEGGEETKVLESVHPWANFTVRAVGIYYFTAPDKQGHSDLSIYEFASNKIKKTLTIERPISLSIEVSPDGQTVLYTQQDESGSNLMLVENFR